jgi:hypothetical protein
MIPFKFIWAHLNYLEKHENQVTLNKGFTMSDNTAIAIWNTRSEVGLFLEWLAHEKGVIPCMNFADLATEYAVTKHGRKNNEDDTQEMD